MYLHGCLPTVMEFWAGYQYFKDPVSPNVGGPSYFCTNGQQSKHLYALKRLRNIHFGMAVSTDKTCKSDKNSRRNLVFRQGFIIQSAIAVNAPGPHSTRTVTACWAKRHVFLLIKTYKTVSHPAKMSIFTVSHYATLWINSHFGA